MALFSKDCVKAAMEKLKDFTEDEVHAYLSEIYQRAKTYENMGSQASVNKAIKEVNNEKMESLMDRVTTTANDVRKFQEKDSSIKGNKLTLNELVIRDRSDKNKDYNIESAQKSKKSQFYKTFHDGLSPQELQFISETSGNDLDVAAAIDGNESTPTAKKIAEAHHKLDDRTTAELVSSNAMPIENINKRRQLHVTHDRSKMLNPGRSLFKIVKSKSKYVNDQAKSRWMDWIKKRIDLEETYKKIGAINEAGELDMERVDRSLERTWNNIINGYSETFTQSGVKNDFEAIKKKQQMFFVWKDTKSWLEYNKEYGSGSYYKAVSSHIHASGNKVGTAEMFGSNPRNMYLNLLHTQQESNPQSKGWTGRADNNFKYISGIDHAAVDPTMATFMSNLRTLAGMSRLGNIGVLSAGDVVKGASHISKFDFLHNQISSFWQPLTNNIKHIFNNPLFTDEERKYIAGEFRMMLDSQVGYMGKFLDSTTPGDVVSKMSMAFYRLNLMHALDKGNKISVMHMMARGLAKMSKDVHANLGDSLKGQLDKYGITPKEWDILRHKNEKDLFTTQNVDALTDAELKSLRTEATKNKPLYEIKNDLYRKVYTLFDVASMSAIGEPEVYMKSFLVGNTKAGTPMGELLRAVLQFKAFPLQHMDRMYMNNYKDLNGPKAKMVFFANMFVASAGMNLLANNLNYFMHGKGFPDFSRMSRPEKAKFIMESMDSNIGMLYKGFSNSYPGKFKAMSLLSSPTTDFVGNMIDALYAGGMGVMTGGDKKSWKRAGKSAKAAAKGVSPTTTFPFLSVYLDHLFGDKPYLQPGQKQIFGK